MHLIYTVHFLVGPKVHFVVPCAMTIKFNLNLKRVFLTNEGSTFLTFRKKKTKADKNNTQD